MMDPTANLKTFAFEYGLSGKEKELLYLRERSAGLRLCGTLIDTFICRESIKEHNADGDSLRVGILGLGHIGKQLLLSLLNKTEIKPSHIQTSTRRPEPAVEFVQKGVECFSDNRRLAAWTDVLFLCCLPSHLIRVCADLHLQLSKHCLVYGFISAASVNRLAWLLAHNFIFKPQYDFVTCDTTDMWLPKCQLTVALKDPVLMQATCPLATNGGISLGPKWLYGVLYSLLNICTAANVESGKALALINKLFKLDGTSTVKVIAESMYVSSSCASALAANESFPWISLIDVQTKQTPLSRFLSSSKPMQEAAYRSLMEKP
ncbi:LOW QUALITY PROTEIN: NADP-dependent oxidoreductase domain-containing protein 1 [Lampris incognitus]|uniref:LOW QUALITY PROTEIN: NADP-dependent oxidoreductase domain-containing protein 1 n=1 Tax=Lampris incognitus TaxID=2546036 RepID=UPI0024B56550|nr:LOW QUALITY PROTEIN: NADP-dependent oxidoreductase domain-containing protein 1 [Lampris incognitus]